MHDHDVSQLSTLAAAVVRKAQIQHALHALKGDASRLDERRALIAEDAAVVERIRTLKEEEKMANLRRSNIGIGGPLHEAVVARFAADVVAELEADAMARLAERERLAVERKAARATLAPSTTHPTAATAPRSMRDAKPKPDVLYLRRPSTERA